MLSNPPKVLVPSSGPLNADIAFLGEAPGTDEVREGEPFVGRSGNLLNKLLQIAGIQRSQCHFNNVIKEQPPKTAKKTNDISVFVDLSKKEVYESQAYTIYLSQLKEELSECSANVIVALGNVPLYALTGIHPSKITSRRGSLYESTLLPGRKVLACIHPAACIHGGKGQKAGNYMFQHYIVQDLRRALEESKYPELKLPQRNLLVDPSFQLTMDYLLALRRGEQTSFDLEVDRSTFEISHAALGPDASNAISIPFFQNRREYFSLIQEAEIWREIALILESKDIVKYGQNLVFDTQVVHRKYGIVTRNIEDTMIAQGVLIPDFPKGLDFITSIYTREPYYKDDGKLYSGKGVSSARIFSMYNAKDGAVCIEAFPHIRERLEVMGNLETYERQKKLVEVLVYMSERGIRVDIDGLKSASVKAGVEIERLKEELSRIVGYEINPNSPDQMKEYFYVRKGIRAYRKRGTGAITTDEDALKRIARKGYPEAQIVLDIRGLVKLRGTYLDVTLDEDGRLRCSYNPVGAADTGRLSSSKTTWGTGMNLQNDPPEFRKCMLADEGYIGYSMDLSQAENRIVAHVGPDINMQEVFASGKDMHKRTAGFIFDKHEDEISDEEGSAPNLGSGKFSERFWGKKADHAFDYDLGYKSFAIKYGLSEAEGLRIRNAFFSAYPGVSENYWTWIQSKLSQDRMLVNLYGRVRRFMNRWGDDLFREAYAFIPQSTVADKVNEEGLIYIYYNQDKFSPVELLIQIHDSIEFQIPVSLGLRKHAEILRDIKSSLETSVKWRESEFVIPAEGKMWLRFGEPEKLKMGGSVDLLQADIRAKYKKLKDKEHTLQF